MKKGGLLATGLVIMMGVAVLSGCTGSVTTLSGFSTQPEGIWVTGRGEVAAVPDILNLSLGIEARKATVEQAQSQAAAAMNRVLETLKDNGIAEKDIQTQRFSISPITKWDRERDEPITTGYRVTNIVVAKIRDLDKAGGIIDAVAKAGGDLTRINSLGFSIDDPSPYQEKAREEAMADALLKARQLAQLGGVTLGKATYISEQVAMPPIIYQERFAAESMMPAPTPAPTPVAPGGLTISATVQVTYAITP